MLSFGDFILKQSKRMLDNKQYAICCAVICAVLPFAAWLSVALVALITLRKGARQGFDVLLPALVVHSVPLMMLVPVDSAFINTLMTYLPCYLAAIALRQTMNWQMVGGIYLLQAIVGILFCQFAMPGFITEQFTQFRALLSQFHNYQELVDLSQGGVSEATLAQLFFGAELISIVASSLIYLMFARSIQAKLFIPGGFTQELLAFRSGKIALLVLLSTILGAYYEIPLALNALFLVLAYFLVAGLNLIHCALIRKRKMPGIILLVFLILLKPTLVLFVYILIGSLDSIFNFRLYLPTRAKEST